MAWVMAPMPPIVSRQVPSLQSTSPKVDSGKQRGSLADGQRIATGIVASNLNSLYMNGKSAPVFPRGALA